MTSMDFSGVLFMDDQYLDDILRDNDFNQYLNVAMDDEQPSNGNKPSPQQAESNAVIPLSVLEQEGLFPEAVQFGESQLPLGFTTDSQIFSGYEVSPLYPQAMTATTSELPGLGSVPVTSYHGAQLVARTSQADTLTVSPSISPSHYLNKVPTYTADHEVPRSPEGQCRADVNNALSSSLPTYGEHYEMLPSQSNSAGVIKPLAPVQPQGQAKRGRPPVIKVPGGDLIVDKKERRRKQNRDAANRCRAKRKNEFEELKKSCDATVEENMRLRNELEDLHRRCRSLEQQLSAHQMHCGLSIT